VADPDVADIEVEPGDERVEIAHALDGTRSRRAPLVALSDLLLSDVKALSGVTDTPVMAYDVDRRPGGWVAEQTQRRELRISVGFAVFVVVAGIMLALALGHRLSIFASTVFLVVVLVLRPYVADYLDEHVRLSGGTDAEESVGQTLNALRHEAGWTVMHDIEQAGEGNIDHLVSGPTGVFLIETKARRYKDVQLVKAKRQAAKVHDELGVWVTPVICLHERGGEAFMHRKVWIVPHRVLLPWLHAQRNHPAEFERLARFADQL
jgi:nuclease-like protein